MSSMGFFKLLAERRRHEAISRTAVARKAGVKTETLRKWENGARCRPPTDEEIRRLSSAIAEIKDDKRRTPR